MTSWMRHPLIPQSYGKDDCAVAHVTSATSRISFASASAQSFASDVAVSTEPSRARSYLRIAIFLFALMAATQNIDAAIFVV